MMPRVASHVCFLIAALFASGLSAASDSAQLDRIYERSTLQIATPDARLHRFRVWIADDDARRARGLMFVRHLEDDQGMLFLYPAERTLSMWMKNTYVSLDMLFFDTEGRITHIHRRAEPLSEAIISPGSSVAVPSGLSAVVVPPGVVSVYVAVTLPAGASAGRSAGSVTRVIPSEEPARQGLTNSGGVSAAASARAPARSVRHRRGLMTT